MFAVFTIFLDIRASVGTEFRTNFMFPYNLFIKVASNRNLWRYGLSSSSKITSWTHGLNLIRRYWIDE
jgi:hypothetical protein